MRCYLSEGRKWLEEALATDGSTTELRARALDGAGHLAWCQGDFERAAALREERLALSRKLGDKAGIAASLNGLAWVARMRGDYAVSRSMLEEALAIHRELDDRRGLAESLFLLGATDTPSRQRTRRRHARCSRRPLPSIGTSETGRAPPIR